MRCNPLRWLWGVVLVFGLLGIVSLRGAFVDIETELKRDSQAALEKAGLEWAKVEFDGRDVTLSGRAADEVEQRAASQIARNLWGVRKVRNRTELIEEQRNYNWTASLRDSRLRMGGFVPNENVRRAIVGAAKATFPQLEIDDRMRLARGAPEPEAWLGAVSFSLKQLSGLKPGARAELDGDGLALTGEAENSNAYQNVKSALANGVPQGIKIKSDKVVPPVAKPFAWTAKLSTGQLQLGGFVPSERAREEISAAAQKEFGQRTIVDRMQIASGEPADFVAAALSTLRKLAQLEEGAAELRDNELQLSGLATKQETAEALRGDLRSGIPESFKISEQIKFREPTIKPVSPYTMTIVVEDAIVRLTGYVPSEAVRTSLVGTIRSRLGERKLSDGLELGAGAPEGWQACAAAGLQGLAKLGKGRIDLVNRSLKFAAVTDDEDVAEAVRGEVRAAANRACDPEFEIVVNAPPEPNIDWHAVLTANELLLEGEVPDEAIRIDLAQSAAKLFPKAKVIDQTVVKAAYSKKWPRVAGLGLRVLSKLRAGEVHLEGAELFVSGQAPDTAIATAVRQQLRDLPKGYSGRDAIEVRSDAMIWAEQEAKKKAEAEARRKVEQERRKEEEDTKKPSDQPLTERAPEARHASVPAEPVKPVQAVTAPAETPSARVDIQPSAEQKQQAALSPEGGNDATCRQALGDTGDHGVIRFDRASSDLSSESISKLNRLAEAAGVCAKLSITIEGHADAEGTPERNQSLSERRAAAVVEYLANRGVPAERLSAVGYGATRPLAPNTTAETRALNRRVEFTLKVN